MSESQSSDVDGLVDRISKLSVPLETALEGGSPDSVFDGASIVGMGEASHGTEELFAARERLTRELIEEHGVRLFAFEATFSAVTPVNEYVQGVDDDPEALFSTPGINWPYRCESLVSFVEWIREFNEGRDPEDTVAVHGIDATEYTLPAARLVAFLRETGHDELICDSLAYLAKVSNGEVDPDEVTLDRVSEAADAVIPSLESAFENGSAADADGARLARLHLDALRGAHELQDDELNLTREEAMADLLESLLEQETDGRAVVWGHDSHLKRGDVSWDGEEPALGERLDRRFGEEYCPLGTEFGGGRVRTIAKKDEGAGYDTYEVDSLGDRSLPAVFGRVADEAFLLNVGQAAEDSVVAEWFDGTPDRRSVSASVDGLSTTAETDLPEAFDALPFVPESSPTELVAPLFPG